MKWVTLCNSRSVSRVSASVRGCAGGMVVPHVLVVTINRTPVFSCFIKLIIEITNPTLIDLVRRKVKLNQPYIGIFLKKNNE